MSNREKGIFYKGEDIEDLLPSETALFEVLRDILTKEIYWRENSGKFKLDTPGITYSYMKFGRWA